jgi:hypothetical protein
MFAPVHKDDATRRFGDHEFPKAIPLIVCCQNRAKDL